MSHRNNRAAAAIRWIQEYCVYPSGPDRGKKVRLTVPEQYMIRHVYDALDDRPQPLLGGPIGAFLTLLHLCGPEARQHAFRPNLAADIFTTWNAAGPELRAVLRLRGGRITCPALGTAYPVAA